ncbi:hypothetical protein [Chryseobacterium indoltheticum]
MKSGKAKKEGLIDSITNGTYIKAFGNLVDEKLQEKPQIYLTEII